MKKNIAVVGCGHWGKNLIRNFYELKSLKAICDPNIDLAESFARKYSVKNLSFKQINSDNNIEGVVLAVPAQLHSEMAIISMKAGKNVFVEKPLAINQHESEEMINCSQENDVKLMVGHLLQYHPVFIALLDLVKLGKIGELNYIYSNRLSFGKVRSEEDVIWSFAPHDISMILSLVDEKPEFVRTESTSILRNKISDIATMHIRFKSGLRAHISVSWLHPYKEQKLVVIGKLGMMVFDDTKPWKEKLALYRHKVNIDNDFTKLDKNDVEYIKVEESEPLQNECKHFLEVVEKNISPKTNGLEGARVQSILTAATQSHETNSEVKLRDYV